MEKQVKKQATREELAAAKEQLTKMVFAPNRDEAIASVINNTYDPEFPVPEVIAQIFDVKTAEPMEHVYYFTPTLPVKTVYVLSGNCTVTNVPVTPASRNELSFSAIVTPNFWICLDELLNGDMNAIEFYAENAIESLNREEIYVALQLIDAAAVSRGNVFAPNSGTTKLDYPKLVEMKKAVNKYGKKLVLVTGANVTEDIALMQYDANKFQAVNIKDVVDVHIPLESLDVTVDGVAKEVIDADTAYLVAVSDAKSNKPGTFVRRKLSGAFLSDMKDTAVVNKERAIMVGGLINPIGSVQNYAKSMSALEQVGVVVSNSYTCVKFVK